MSTFCRSTSRRFPTPRTSARPVEGTGPTSSTQIDVFTGVILDKLDELDVTDHTIVLWS